jgi:Transposase DDE domain
MRAAKLLHDLLDNASQSIDKRLRRTLFEAAETLAHCKHLSIATLGRHLPRKAKVKHTIKCIDRLFGNNSLNKKSEVIYGGMAAHLLKGQKRPSIIIDWSGLTPCGAFHFLRASLAVNGRSLTLYDQAYPLSEYCKERVHKSFLSQLQKLIPADCRPIVITDAGFRNSWFRAVKELGWDFIGRVRNNTQYCLENESIWKPIKSLYMKATMKPTLIGSVQLAKYDAIACYFHLVKQEKKYREKRNLIGTKVRCSSSIKHEIRENEPWLIATSLSIDDFNSNSVIAIYKKRMQIEEAFRDLKNTRNGFGLRHCRSFRVERLNVALLIASLAMLVLWIFGNAAKQKNMHYSYQANTEKRSTVLSVILIGWQVLIRDELKFKRSELMAALPKSLDVANGRAL